jgi:hypothetical protein
MVRGVSDDAYRPDAHVRRDQAASFVNHLLGRAGRDLASGDEEEW